jgi:hypothetical protein
MTQLLSVDQALDALPVKKSRRWLVSFLHSTPTDPAGRPLYRLMGRDKLIYLDRLIEALQGVDIEGRRRDGVHDSFVYFVASGEFIKIGFSKSLKARFHKLKTDVPVELELLHIEPGTPKQEKLFHRQFAAIRSHGEWFRRTPELIAFIEERKRIRGEAK